MGVLGVVVFVFSGAFFRLPRRWWGGGGGGGGGGLCVPFICQHFPKVNMLGRERKREQPTLTGICDREGN